MPPLLFDKKISLSSFIYCELLDKFEGVEEKTKEQILKERELYKNLDIKDADFEDMNKKENE